MQRLIVALMVAVVIYGSGAAGVAADGERASGALVDGSGKAVGAVQLTQTAGAVTVSVTATGLKPGLHGIHLHAVGRCEGPAFTSAGGHFNPTNKKHGLKSPDGAHGGDLPNLEARADGTATFTATTTLATLSAGPTSIFDADGTALVIHANPDDEMTDPTGNSGDRVACAEIKMQAVGLPRTGDGGATDAASAWLAALALLGAGAAGWATLRRGRLSR